MKIICIIDRVSMNKVNAKVSWQALNVTIKTPLLTVTVTLVTFDFSD